MVELQRVKVKPYGKNWVRGIRDTWNMIICKLMIDKLEILCWCLLQLCWCFWLIRVIERCRVHGREGDWRHSEERGELRLLGLFLHVLIHFLSWCHNADLNVSPDLVLIFLDEMNCCFSHSVMASEIATILIPFPTYPTSPVSLTETPLSSSSCPQAIHQYS
jgi:hypothetical protein